MAEEFTGFANAVDKKGKSVDASKVKAFTDKTEAGKVRAASQTTASSIARANAEAKAGASAETAPTAEGEEVSGS